MCILHQVRYGCGHETDATTAQYCDLERHVLALMTLGPSVTKNPQTQAKMIIDRRTCRNSSTTVTTEDHGNCQRCVRMKARKELWDERRRMREEAEKRERVERREGGSESGGSLRA